ncbi:MAG: hypothetical protein CMM52_14375 [Rhodospirillaceae bacterium]|nr:hypothetical protein [Rhodospirillaceae bacterium]
MKRQAEDTYVANTKKEQELIEAEREHLLFVIRYALAQNFKHRPNRRDHFTEDDFSAWAQHVVNHMELTGLRFFKEKEHGPGHFRPDV